MSAELSWQQLPIDTPSTAAFMLNGSFTGERIGEFTVNIGRSLQPLPKRLFLDIRGLKQIDRAGIDTMAGMLVSIVTARRDFGLERGDS